MAALEGSFRLGFFFLTSSSSSYRYCRKKRRRLTVLEKSQPETLAWKPARLSVDGVVAALLLRGVALLLLLRVVVDVWRAIWRRQRGHWHTGTRRGRQRETQATSAHPTSWPWAPRGRWAGWTESRRGSRRRARRRPSAGCGAPAPEPPRWGAASPGTTVNTGTVFLQLKGALEFQNVTF